MAADPTPHLRVHLLTAADESDLLAFETTNRDFFAGAVGDRGDEYFRSFSDRHGSLVAENEAGTSMLFVVRDGEGRVVGRVNLADVEDGSGDLGYRLAEQSCGRGYARAAVRLALEEAAARGLRRVTAMTTEGNVSSQRVLDANGFERVPGGVPAEVEVGGRTEPTVHFVLTLDGPVSRRAGR